MLSSHPQLQVLLWHHLLVSYSFPWFLLFSRFSSLCVIHPVKLGHYIFQNTNFDEFQQEFQSFLKHRICKHASSITHINWDVKIKKDSFCCFHTFLLRYFFVCEGVHFFSFSSSLHWCLPPTACILLITIDIMMGHLKNQ